ncbi:MAG TPA: TonB family protein [Allosphingosinicella sp.]
MNRRLFGLCVGLVIFPFLAGPAVAQVSVVRIGAEDYPLGVVPGSERLNLAVHYELASNGTIAACTVTRSSGVPVLDFESCRILQERARFRPERAAMRGTLRFEWYGQAERPTGRERGDPLAINYPQWYNSDDYPSRALARDESGLVEFEVTVSANGAPQSCRVTASSHSEALDAKTCEVAMARGAFIPASNGAGGRRAGVFHARMRWNMFGG